MSKVIEVTIEFEFEDGAKAAKVDIARALEVLLRMEELPLPESHPTPINICVGRL